MSGERPSRPALLLGTVALLILPVSGFAESPEDPVRDAAQVFGQAMTQAKTDLLEPILPKEGKIRLHLIRMGPESGFYGPGQVRALLGDFLARGAIRSFELIRIEPDAGEYALAHGAVVMTDRHGQEQRASLHLAFQFESDRCVLREIRESGP